MEEELDNHLQNEDIEQKIVSYTLYRDITPPKNLINIKLSEKKLKNNLKFDKKYQSTIPLLIKDILNLRIDENSFGKNLYAYGIQFGAVMIYGICTPKGCDYKSTKLKYTLDDGTGEINIKYAINNNKKCKDRISVLREELEIELRKTRRDPKLCPENINQSLSNLLRKAEENVNIPENHYKAGSRLYVVGIPYKIHKDIWIHAKQIDLDQGQCRNKEILYKEHLIRFYNRYSKIVKLDGSNIE